ncbi:MAG TPA: L-seryl-tRNA(Sec) selenium transferase [Oscillospiraceae bacterium]|nr:L-seryl-tRNA(Sec) selenium transferase [Oscillospiraceae bacterium]
MVENWRNEYLRSLPAVDAVLMSYQSVFTDEHYAHTLLVQVVQEVLAQLRQQILAAPAAEKLVTLNLTPQAVASVVQARLESLKQPSLRRVINATGTVLHTNLGRAPLAQAATTAITEAAHYCNLELELQSGKRGSRHVHVEKLLQRLTGAEAACVVNNNAAAVFVALNTLAAGKQVIVSRGELVEIGGSFRIPEVMAASGAELVEVGTTNKTHLRDYRNAVGEETALLLKVHTSNYQVVGFTAAVGVAALVELAQEVNLPVMEDLGSGMLLDLSAFGLAKEPLITERIAAGVDVLTLSGDKLLGGPQAGIIVGKRKYIEQIKRNQLLRALRPDKFTLAALEATLQIYVTGNPLQEVPVLAKLSITAAALRQRAAKLAAAITAQAQARLIVEVREDVSYVGGGAMPTTYLPTYVIAVRHRQVPLHQWVAQLRLGTPALVGRVQDDWLLLDPRTIAESEEEEVVQCLT